MPRLNLVRVLGSTMPEPGPRRVYALSLLINTFGTGLLMVSLPLYLIRVVELSAMEVGLGLTIAATITLVAGMPLGDLADRRGPLGMTKAMLLVQCAATIGLLFITNFATFVVVVTVEMVAGRAIVNAEGALLRRVADDSAAGFRSLTHAITNVGFSLGFAGSGIAIQIGTPAAFQAVIVVNALTFIGAWIVLHRAMPRYDPLPVPHESLRWGVLRDKAFVAFSVVGAAFSLQFSVLLLLLPVWVAEKTNAPGWAISASLVINTVLVVAFQVRLGGKVQTLRQGGLAWRRAGLAFLGSCVLLGFTAGLPGWAALLMIIAAVSVHTVGEIWHLAGGFALGMGLPPAHAQGQYDGFSSILGGIGAAVAPVLLLGPILEGGRTGLTVLGAFFALTSLLMPAVARWGERTRPTVPDTAGAKVVDAPA
ncbi:MFS family permease [Micromonospora profundi]|uniref:MFS transporter n=1 Tax=Micromonospora profundi TaxID=1420889 RepID=UPI0014394B8F|nr:MFS transporter [Micromonospora profundi]NJC11455.1 MFS family permease [Micromonospora profundi]